MAGLRTPSGDPEGAERRRDAQGPAGGQVRPARCGGQGWSKRGCAGVRGGAAATRDGAVLCLTSLLSGADPLLTPGFLV